ncbi:MAG: FAD-dependent oxidoreductase, partial [Candidatus Aenigmarchaeota archaeon]|nr:FAD-dependent oxidoreductase [Candidatus Aenigmarchaeota archaeon]
MYDVIIIGGGPAGMTAGLYSTWFGMKVLLFDDIEAPSQLALATEVKNYPGIETITGTDLVKAFHDQT